MNLKKGLVVFFVFLLAFSNSAFAATGTSPQDVREGQQKERVTKGEFSKDIKEKSYAQDEEVRVIVELKDKPVIYSAQSLGKSYSELSESNKEKLRKAALDAQSEVKQSINRKSIAMDFKESFTTVLNGFSGTVKYGSIKMIEKLDNVGKVHITHEYERPTEDPEMLYSKELVNAQKTWQDYGYKGEGMTVAVIDTGIDPDHKDMVLSEETDPELSKEEVDSWINDDGLNGKYFTEKVPYAYNYADDNHTVLDLGPDASEHGMHVSGTVGANGDEDNGGIKGVAPEAQILGMKVFGNDPEMPSTYGDIYIKAIDDAIVLGADVINMSLGSTAGFVNEDDPEQRAIANAVDNGVMMSISAGNSARLGDGFYPTYASDPDYGVVGAPGITPESLQVAAFENEYLNLSAFTPKVDGETMDPIPFLSASSVSPDTLEGYQEVVYAGLGRTPGDSDVDPEANDFEGVDVEGKIALIQRGQSTFVSKTLNAQERGAIGVIIFNNVDGYISMASSSDITIPQLSISKVNGEMLRDKLQNDQTVEIAFEGNEVKTKNPEAGKMSSFTSWGVTPNLNFKPEITAPGGNILSTLQDDEYGMMSGTSMAAPHVSGGSALVMQRVDEEFDYSGSQRVETTKNILMNTSVPQVDKGTDNEDGLYYSPRRMGTGLMDLHAAMKTPVMATDKATGIGKVALKEMGDQESFTLELENVSDENTVYNVTGSVQTDLVGVYDFGSFNFAEANPIYKKGTKEFPIEITSPNGSDVEGDYQVVVPANSTVEVNVSLDLENVVDGYEGLSPEELFENGHFVEGFVTFTDPNDTNPELNVPYVGFHGEWDQARNVDATIYEDPSKIFYGETALLSWDGQILGVSPLLGEDDPLAGSEENVGFSPNGDESMDEILPNLSFLRNAKEVEFNILDEDGNELRTVRTEDEVKKNYFDGGAAPASDPYPQATWDGKVNGEVVEDGQYYYEVKSVIDFEDAEWQSKKIPVKVDTQAPDLEVSYDKETGEVSWDAFDEGTGLSHFDIVVNGESVLEEPLGPDEGSYTFEKLDGVEGVKVVAHDYAGNAKTDAVAEGDDTIPAITAITPEALSVTNEKEVQVIGFVQDDSKVEKLTIDGKEAKLKWDEEENVYNFSETLNYKKDGVKEIEFYAVDDQGNDISFKRKFMIDSTSPELEIEGPHTTKEDTATLEISMKDNWDDLRLFVNGSEEYKHVFKEPFEMRAISETIEHEVQLEDGRNTFEFELTDFGGNTTTKMITIYKSDEGPKDFDDVSDGFWGKEAIEKLNVAGVINGYPNGDFGVNDEIIRADAAAMIVRAFDLDTDNPKDPGFTDVEEGDYMYEEIAAIAEAGIMNGSPDGSFDPKANLKRSEMAKIVVEAYDLKGSTSKRFEDVPLYHWAQDYINTLAANKITIGYPDGTFKPDNNTTRAEFAMFLARAEDDRFKED
ncbi:S8 family serine peptidase [Halobacillus mangrovi]|uniref:S8 family serine peptidase n=1 Tax=Halobacillus mangrovi TaxID=402384 RepID=UPI003D96E82F